MEVRHPSRQAFRFSELMLKSSAFAGQDNCSALVVFSDLSSMKRIVNLICFVLLLWIAADAAMPQPCCLGLGERRYSPASGSEVSESNRTRSVPSISQSVAHQDPSDASACEDDCLCCAHAMVVKSFSGVSSLCQSNLIAISNEARLPSPQLRTPYHPPRLA